MWLLVLLLASPLAHAQAPAWQSVVSPGGGTSGVYATATDASGNIYTAGGFSGTVTFGSTTLTSAGARDLFVAKWSPVTGSFVWAQQAGGSGEEYVNSMTVSGNSVYIVGVFGSSQVVLGNATLPNTGYSSTGNNYDGYVAKLTDAGSSGSFTWAQGFGGSGSEYGNGVAVIGARVYVSGVFTSPTASFGTINLLNAGTTAGTSDAYVAKLTDAGSSSSFGWAERLGGPGSDFCSSLASNGTSLYLAGSFSGATATFGPTTLTNSTAGVEDVFVVRLTDQGAAPSYNWVQQAGGSSTDQALRIAVSPGSVYLAGRFNSTTATFGSTVLTNAGGLDAYVAKLTDTNSAGTFAWAQAMGGPSSDYAYALAVRGSSVYVGGVFQSTATFGTSTATSRGLTDVFVARLVDAGPTAQVAWVQSAGGTGTDDLFSIILIGNRVYAGGDVTPPATFGSLSVAGPTGVGIVGFLASITDAAGLPTAVPTARLLPGLHCYPNPARGTALVTMPPSPGTAATLTLLDGVGRMVRTVELNSPATGLEQSLDLVGLAPGSYLVRLTTGAGTATQPLLVE